MTSDEITFTERFRDFARGKGDEEYDSADIYTCALAQFGYPLLNRWKASKKGVPPSVYDAAVHRGPYTFSALAARLDAILLQYIVKGHKAYDKEFGK